MSRFPFFSEVHLSSFNATTHRLERTAAIAASYHFWRAVILAQQYMRLYHMALACKRDRIFSFPLHNALHINIYHYIFYEVYEIVHFCQDSSH